MQSKTNRNLYIFTQTATLRRVFGLTSLNVTDRHDGHNCRMAEDVAAKGRPGNWKAYAGRDFREQRTDRRGSEVVQDAFLSQKLLTQPGYFKAIHPAIVVRNVTPHKSPRLKIELHLENKPRDFRGKRCVIKFLLRFLQNIIECKVLIGIQKIENKHPKPAGVAFRHQRPFPSVWP